VIEPSLCATTSVPNFSTPILSGSREITWTR
jgi:hypothetical protein